MGFWTRLFAGLKGEGQGKGRLAISQKMTQAEDETKPESTTAPREFDELPSLWQIRQMETPLIRSGFYGEVLDAWDMYKYDDRVRATIDSIADDATQINRNGLPFNVIIKTQKGEQDAKTEEFQAMLHRKFKELSIYQRSSDIIKFSLLEGSRFYRQVVDLQSYEITELRHIKGPRDGFILVEIPDGEYTGYYVQFEYQSQQPVAAFLPWEVIRFDWNRPDEAAFGMGLFSSARPNQKRLAKAEQDMYIARKSRAYARVSREFPNASIEQLLKMRQADEEERKKHPLDIESDIYTTGKANVLDTSNSALFNIEDVEHAQRRLFASGRRPVSLLGGYGKDAVNRAVLDRQEHRYISGFLSSVCEMFDTGMARLVNTQLILWDLWPQDWQVSFEWTRKSVEDKKILAEIAKDGVDRKALPLSIYPTIFDLDPKEINKEIEEDLARLAEWEEMFGMPPLEDKGFQPPEE